MNQLDGTTAPATVAVVGLGLLGRGIATCFLGHGYHVIGCDHDSASRQSAREYIERGLREMVAFADFNPAILSDWQSRYHETCEFIDWPPCDFVVESVDEDAGVKKAVFDQIERVVASGVPVASNTSAIPISILQAACQYPNRFLGMHWFEPAHATRFLELIPGEQTSQAVMDAATIIARKCGKEPSVLNKDIPGFIVNRLGYALYREAVYLLELGVADAETIDRSFRNAIGVWSAIFGPFQWMDLTGGPALYGAAMERVLPTLSTASNLTEPIRRLTTDASGEIKGPGFYECSPEQIARTDALFHERAWEARRMMNRRFPLKDE